MKLKKIVAALLVASCVAAQAQSLPAGSIGSVDNPSSNYNGTYSFNFTAAQTGSNYIGFAFRQDPAYWNFTNVSLTTGGGSNLLTNGSMSAGGVVNINTTNGPGQIQAPTNWGVWYQNGTYPAAAGFWNGGAWYDGAVGSYDGIYQGINLNAGTTYTIRFDALSTSQAGSVDQARIGVYAGTCSSLTLTAAACVPNTPSFTPIATPSQTVNAGNPSAPPVPVVPSAPTVVSTANDSSSTSATTTGTPTSTLAVVAGVTTYAVAQSDARARQATTLNITRTTTTAATTPLTRTTTTVTPVTVTTTTVATPVDTYSDGSTVRRTADATTTVSSQTTNQTTTSVENGTATAVTSADRTYSTRIDQYDQLAGQNTRINATLDSDPLSRLKATDGGLAQRTGDDRDWNFYINGTSQQSNTSNSYKYNANIYGLGFEKKVENNVLVGVQYNHAESPMSGQQGSGNLSKDAVGIYALANIENFLIKGDLGYAFNKYDTSHNLPELGLSNNSTSNGTDKWAALRAYTPALYGFRPYVGGRLENNQRNSTGDTGSSLSAVNYAGINNTKSTAEAGLRYENEFAKDWTAVAEAGRNTAQLNTFTASAIYAATNNSSVIAKVIRQEQTGVVANQAMLIGRINF